MEKQSIELSLKIGKKRVSLKLKGCWCPELAEDLEKYHEIDVTCELLSILGKQIVEEIEADRLIHKLLAQFGEDE